MNAGEFQRIRAGDLHLITEVEIEGQRHVLQRWESDSHVRSIGGENWDSTLEGVLTVHRLIDHPTQPGVLHLGDGGSRWRAKTDRKVIEPNFIDLDYIFDCMTQDVMVTESARRFLGTTKGRKNVSKLDEYYIALTAESEWAHAIEKALKEHNLVISRFPHFGNGVSGRVAAVGACEVVVRNSYRVSESWDAAEEHLRDILTITRRGFHPILLSDREEAAYAHEATLLRALSWILLRNQDKLAKESNRQRISDKFAARPVTFWKGAAEHQSSARGKGSGSGGRPLYLAAVIANEYNKRLKPPNQIVGPKLAVYEQNEVSQ